MTNPFDIIDQRLSSIESALLDIQKTDLTQISKSKQTNSDNLKTSKEASKFLGVSLVTLHKWKTSGLVKSYKVGTRIRYRQSDLENALTSRQK